MRGVVRRKADRLAEPFDCPGDVAGRELLDAHGNRKRRRLLVRLAPVQPFRFLHRCGRFGLLISLGEHLTEAEICLCRRRTVFDGVRNAVSASAVARCCLRIVPSMKCASP